MDARTSDQVALLKEVIDRSISKFHTSIPGIIDSFDPATQTASVIPGVLMKTNIDDEEGFIEYPLITNVPVCFPLVSVNGFGITLPVAKGDPCYLSFSQRSIDNWHERGGIQPPEDGRSSRHHDLTDAIAFLAPIPLPEVFEDWEMNGLEIRNRVKDVRITLLNDKVEIAVGTSLIQVNKDGDIGLTSLTKVSVNTPLAEFSGDIIVAGDIEAGGNVKDVIRTMVADRVIYNSHTHDENGDGGGTTDPPNQGQ